MNSEELLKALTVIAEGHRVEGHDGRFVVVDNPDYKPDNGSNPCLVIDVWELSKGLRCRSAPPAVTEGTSDAVRKLIYESVRFALWAGSQGISPADGENARAPEEFVYEYVSATGDEDEETLPARAIAMLSAAPTPPVDDGWRPIETAPKDGTDVLLWDGEEIFVGYWSDSIWVSPGAWVKEEHRSDTVTYIPTHWMPLPAAPTEARDE